MLLSYITGPFTLFPWQFHTDPHTSYWECAEMARQFAKRGYDVDIISWQNDSFIPHKKYKICIDIQKNLGRLEKFLQRDCLKVMHIVSAESSFQNKAEQKRIDDLKARRGIAIAPQRTLAENDNPGHADFLEGFGNKTTKGSYKIYGKEIFDVPISVAKTYPFPANKNFEKAKKQFLWFGGGGAVHKGVDLVLEAFAETPQLSLHIAGPIASERDFVKAYKKELSLPNIFVHGRPKLDKIGNMTIDGQPFSKLTDKCATVIYPSCSEGASGAVIQAMHAGLFPIITPETGIDENAPSIIIDQPTVQGIKNVALEFSEKSTPDVERMSREAWIFANHFHTKKTFSQAYSDFIDNILKA